MQFTYVSNTVEQTQQIGEAIGSQLKGGEVFNLQSDLGGGKTTFVRGLSKGFGSPDPVASPSFTISYVYKRSDKKELHHFDFYRLHEPGIIKNELVEVLNLNDVVVAIEWGDSILDELGDQVVTIKIINKGDDKRLMTFDFPESLQYLFKHIERKQGSIA